MSVKSEPDDEVDVERLDSNNLVNENQRSSAAILYEMLRKPNESNNNNGTIIVESGVAEPIPGGMPSCTTDVKGHVCVHCGKLYKNALTLEVHSRLKHPSEYGDIEVPCGLCGKTYTSLLSLQNHQRYMHRFSHRCTVCGRRFETSDLLSNHAILCVKSERPCPTCGKKYDTQISLRNHVKYKHPEMKTIWCGICRRSFTTNRGLFNHVSISHPGAMTCSSCDKKFTSVAEFQSHVLYQHSENSYRCFRCRKAFASHKSLMRHSALNHNLVVYDWGKYVCGACNASFWVSDALIQHVIDQHSDTRI